MKTVQQTAGQLGLSDSRVRILLKQGRIPGAVRFSGVWIIPDDFTVTVVRSGRPKGTQND